MCKSRAKFAVSKHPDTISEFQLSSYTHKLSDLQRVGSEHGITVWLLNIYTFLIVRGEEKRAPPGAPLGMYPLARQAPALGMGLEAT